MSFAKSHEYFPSFTSQSGWILGDECLVAGKITDVLYSLAEALQESRPRY